MPTMKRPAHVCIEQQCLRHVKDLVCHIMVLFNQAKKLFVHYSIANQGMTSVDSSGSAFMGLYPLH